MKTTSLLLALLNALVAALVLALSLSADEWRQSGELWSVVKVASAAFVIGAGTLTWLDGMRPQRQALMLASGVALVALGSAVFVWTIHLGLVTGDLEAYMLAFGGSLMLQGTASALASPPEPSQATAA
jgi:hypothetical protein